MTLAAGSKLGPYEILAPIGAGGMGEVYRAKDPRLGREVAIKVLPATYSQDADRLRRFEQEARAAGLLNHPNITAVYDIGSHDGAPYVVQELLEGETLRSILSAGWLSPRKTIDYALQIADGLAAAHEKRIVHRDLKPENLFVTSDGRVKILDFGLAKLTHQEEGPQSTDLPTAGAGTDPGVVLGTLGYMSPEQLRGKPADARSDIFSLGAILYEMFSGKRAFVGDSAADTMSAILKEEPPELTRTRPDFPPALDHVVRHCLEKGPGERFQSARDLRFALKEATNVVGPARVERPARRSSLLPVAGAVLLVVIVVLLTVYPGGLRGRFGRGGATSTIRSLAVLPLQNLSHDPTQEYFSDGMTESLITDLAKVKGLLVIARNSVFQYKNRSVDVRSVGAALGVRYVLEGSVQRAGDSVRVNAQLIDAETGYHVWADRYDRPMKDIFALQDDISRHVIGALRVALEPAVGPPLRPSPAPSLEAYDAYLRGIFYSEQRFNWEQSERSIDSLERAVTLDRGFARAHAALATAYARRAFEGDPQGTWAAKARTEIEKTLSLDPNAAEVYVARASLAWTLENGFPHEEAIADYRRALASSPNLQVAHKGLAGVYYHVGLLDEALKEFQAAARIDPHDLDAIYRIPRIHLYQQKYAEALAEFDATPEFRRDFQKPLVLAHMGRLPEALAAGRSELTNPTHSKPAERADAASTIAVLQALKGDAAGAQASIATAVEEGDGLSHFHHAAYNIATAYALIGKKPEALRFVRKVAEEGMPCYPLFEKDPYLENLRPDPAFVAFLAQIKAQWEKFRSL